MGLYYFLIAEQLYLLQYSGIDWTKLGCSCAVEYARKLFKEKEFKISDQRIRELIWAHKVKLAIQPLGAQYQLIETEKQIRPIKRGSSARQIQQVWKYAVDNAAAKSPTTEEVGPYSGLPLFFASGIS